MENEGTYKLTPKLLEHLGFNDDEIRWMFNENNREVVREHIAREMQGNRPGLTILDEAFQAEQSGISWKHGEFDHLPLIGQDAPEEPYVDLVALIQEDVQRAYWNQLMSNQMTKRFRPLEEPMMNRAERREYNRRNGLNSDGSPKKRAL